MEMHTERFMWLAGVIAAHRGKKLAGRTRLQKTVTLLQRLGLPTDYEYQHHFYGPYSEGVQADIALLEAQRFISERKEAAGYVFEANQDAEFPDMRPYKKYIDILSKTDKSILELAATYDSFREIGGPHEQAAARLRAKKPDKWSAERERVALDLLRTLGLPSSA
jgi:uncharacterized protein YwgA